LILDAFQAGLSWEIIINKRENFRRAFDNFNAKKIAMYKQEKIESLLCDAGIIRNRLKISATISNAQAFLQVQKEFGSFDSYIWQFVNGKTIKNSWKTLKEIPVESKEALTMSKDLKKRGMVNDHLMNCFRY